METPPLGRSSQTGFSSVKGTGRNSESVRRSWASPPASQNEVRIRIDRRQKAIDRRRKAHQAAAIGHREAESEFSWRLPFVHIIPVSIAEFESFSCGNCRQGEFICISTASALPGIALTGP